MVKPDIRSKLEAMAERGGTESERMRAQQHLLRIQTEARPVGFQHGFHGDSSMWTTNGKKRNSIKGDVMHALGGLPILWEL